MKVIFLCAGYATRLYPLTENQPKPLLSVGDRPILEWILAGLSHVKGIDQFYIVTNHKFAGHFESWQTKSGQSWPVKVIDDRTTSNDNRLGAIGDLRFVLTQEGIGAEDILVVAGDNLFDSNLADFVESAVRHRPHPVLAVYDVKDRNLAKQYGLVKVKGEGEVVEFLEKPAEPPTTLASCGLYWLPRETRDLLDRYLKEGNNADQPGHYMSWLARTDRLFAVAIKGNWFDIGDLASYRKANDLSSQFRNVPIS